MSVVNAAELIRWLCSMPRETEWLEFKVDRFDPESFGQYVSGLANAAILHEEQCGYLVFGVEDATRKLVGTDLRLKERKIGNQEFELWLAMHLEPRITFTFIQTEINGSHIELVCIHPSYTSPVTFKNVAYIRIGTSLTTLRKHPERERSIWTNTSRFSFEDEIAAANVSADEVFDIAYCEHLMKFLQINKTGTQVILEHLELEGLIINNRQGGYDVTNLLVVLAGRDMGKFPHLRDKAPRVVQYKGTSKIIGLNERTGKSGYGVAFESLLSYILAKTPHQENMKHGKRETEYMVPDVVFRELIANALIHQDFSSVGDGPLVDIFEDRVVVTNPGKPLISPDRFIDAPPKTRNEKLSAYMKRLKLCERRGSGVDRAIEAIERRVLWPPLFREVGNSTSVTIYLKEIFFKDLSFDDRLRACYQHTCLCHERGSSMTNASLRERLGLPSTQHPQVSALIKDSIEAGLIRPLEPGQPNRQSKYVPSWA